MESDLPAHIAIIMDGNGRWAKSRSHPRIWGHVRGAYRVKPVVRACDDMGVKALTLFAFSTENWLRPKDEVDGLMKLMKKYLRREVNEMDRENLRFRAIGDRSSWPKDVYQEVERTEKRLQENTGFQLTFAFGYGSKQELAGAVRRIAQEVENGAIEPRDIDEEMIGRYLMTDELPQLDLLIRTGGEQRLSNFLLWQSAYAELYFTQDPWPEFTVKHLKAALHAYQMRQRRYGLTCDQAKIWQELPFPQQLNGF
jgi:undecaprenyl diphosphate synthase